MFIDPKTVQAGQQFEMQGYVVMSIHGGVPMFISCELDGYITLGTASFTFTVPDGFNPIAQAVSAVDREIESKIRDHQVVITALREKKNQLLQITYQGNEILDPAPTQEAP